MHKQQGWPQAWEYSQAKLIQTLGRALQGVDWSWSQCIKSHHAQTSSGKGLPSHFWTRDNVRSILPGLWRKRNGLLLSGPKSSFQMKANFAFNLEIKVPESGGRVERHRIHVAWSPVWSFHSQWWFGLPCHLLVLVHCVFWSPQSTQPSTRKFLEHFMLPSADKLYGDADFIFQQDLAPAHTAKGTKSWFNDHGVTVLDWPANSPDLNPIENLWGIVKRKMRDTRPNNADELKATVKETWASIPPQQCHKLITSITIKRNKDLNYFSLCALNLFNTRVSQFELNYWNKWTFPRHSNLLRCTCIWQFYSCTISALFFMSTLTHR